MLAVRFWFDGLEKQLSVERQGQLRDIQHELCRIFGQRFPAMKASLDINGTVSDEFGDMPWENAGEDEAGSVSCMIYIHLLRVTVFCSSCVSGYGDSHLHSHG